MSAILTEAEVADLTDRTQPAAQARWLEARKWRFERGPSGRVKVARSFFEFMMGPQPDKLRISVGIDHDALAKRIQRG